MLFPPQKKGKKKAPPKVSRGQMHNPGLLASLDQAVNRPPSNPVPQASMPRPKAR